MRLKRSNAGARVSVLVSFVVLSVLALTTSSAFAIPEGRAYELVSPFYKAGTRVDGILAVAPDGESVAFSSRGAFAGDPADTTLHNDYVARREASRWATVPLNAPAALAPSSPTVDFSSDLAASLTEAKLGPNRNRSEYFSLEAEYLLHDTRLPDLAANFERVGALLSVSSVPTGETGLSLIYDSASPDLSHVVFGSIHPLSREATGIEGEHPGLYDLAAGASGGAPSLQIVALNNQKKLMSASCNETLGVATGSGLNTNQFNAVAAGGTELFFALNSPPGAGGEGCAEQVFVRLAGVRTVEVSRPLSKCVGKGVVGEVPCDDAAGRPRSEFQGASEDGSRVFFTTTAPLVTGAGDVSNNLYLATIGCPAASPGCGTAVKEVTSLTEVSRDPESGGSAEVQGVTAVERGGSRAYFVARGVLSGEPGPEGRVAVRGADNLYVYSTGSGRTSFIGDLCSGPELSGAVEDTRCPASLPTNGNDELLWSGESGTSNGPEAQVSGDGRYLVFSSFARLVRSDTDEAKDVYRYDSVTGRLVRVSVGEAGFDSNGNGSGCEGGRCDAAITGNRQSGPVYEQQDLNSRAVSGDGSRVVFTSSEPLSASAVNDRGGDADLANAYEWHETPGSGEGAVSLVSTGGSDQPVEQVVISETGNDIFFVTSQGLVPQDTDGQYDLYDARLGGGFSPAPTEPQPCAGDACQGPLTPSAALLVPGSVSQTPGEDYPAPAAHEPAGGLVKAPLKCAKGKRVSHGRCVTAKSKRKKGATRAKRAGRGRGLGR